MNSQPVTVNRTLVGIIGLGLLGVAGLISLLGAEGNSDLWSGACLKVGLVMAALWLALPSITRSEDFGRASWITLLGALALALIVARTKVSLKIVLPVLAVTVIALRVLRPRRTSANRPPRKW
jgi:hypothetical protein